MLWEEWKEKEEKEKEKEKKKEEREREKEKEKMSDNFFSEKPVCVKVPHDVERQRRLLWVTDFVYSMEDIAVCYSSFFFFSFFFFFFFLFLYFCCCCCCCCVCCFIGGLFV